MIHCKSISFKLPHHQLGPIDLHIKPGYSYALLGPSGAGKSTFLKLLTRDLSPHLGEIVFDGKSLNQWSLAKLSKRRAVLPQSHQTSFDLSVRLIVSLGRVDVAPHTDELQAALCLAHAEHLIDRSFHSLSGGEAARVQLARIFYQLWRCQGGYLFMDEPVASLDPGLQHQILKSAIGFSKERKLGLLTIVHDMNQAIEYFDEILTLDRNGKMQFLKQAPHAIYQLEKLYQMKLKIITDLSQKAYFMAR
jgi:iron complex transport system ATP-binding protein